MHVLANVKRAYQAVSNLDHGESDRALSDGTRLNVIVAPCPSVNPRMRPELSQDRQEASATGWGHAASDGSVRVIRASEAALPRQAR